MEISIVCCKSIVELLMWEWCYCDSHQGRSACVCVCICINCKYVCLCRYILMISEVETC